VSSLFLIKHKMNLWDNYKKSLYETLLKNSCPSSVWANWEGIDDSKLVATNHYPPYFLKSREVLIWDKKSCIYNNIFYPKTGSNLPCFGMDLMGFFDKKVIIVFDFQHPQENYLFSVGDILPKHRGEIRFFQPGNHFSENLFVAKCAMNEVDQYLDIFKKYLTVYSDMVEYEKPTGTDLSVYYDFDNYMKKLDPVSGYLTNKFGKQKSESLVNNFLFSYG